MHKKWIVPGAPDSAPGTRRDFFFCVNIVSNYGANWSHRLLDQRIFIVRKKSTFENEKADQNKHAEKRVSLAP